MDSEKAQKLNICVLMLVCKKIGAKNKSSVLISDCVWLGTMTIDNRQIPPGPKSHKSETQLLMLSTNQRLKWFCNQQFCLNISCVELGREINKEVRLPKFLSDAEIASLR